MRTGHFKKTTWARIDVPRPWIKATLNVPSRAANEYLYGDPNSACLAIPLATEDSDIALIDGAFKLLTSKDPGVRAHAWTDLCQVVGQRTRTCVFHQDLSAYMSGSDDGHLRIPASSSSIWSLARSASHRLGVFWLFDDGDYVSLSHADASLQASKRTRVFRTLRTNLRKARSEKLLSLQNQGKALECAASARASCHFFRDGSFTRFADWRFVHRARFNLVPLNGVRHGTDSERGCRRCNYNNETLPHVLCRCMRYSRLFQQRHNAIVELIKKAASRRWNVLSENQAIEDLPLRPDLVFTRYDSCLILDITVPFEN
ncbi:uncharacterized protein LOC118204965 [Stegodyphus dumicola]|uniref:uncharacterized protein LOC118204965 n=1 Tax=Stegodyphus dumicola TaxID=202533 RepID=UPI0015B1FC28|nr:uncharacterized protein LOC118204965 [Stegodyphus dumicola]